eukprot:scaffold33213_cov21-Tisochrysis_lutea.AAC.2
MSPDMHPYHAAEMALREQSSCMCGGRCAAPCRSTQREQEGYNGIWPSARDPRIVRLPLPVAFKPPIKASGPNVRAGQLLVVPG